MKRTIYEAVYDGMFSGIIEHGPADHDYEVLAGRVEAEKDLVNIEFSYSRQKVVRALRRNIQERIADLQRCLKRIK